MINAYSDLIVTTKPLNLIGKEVIVVSPFFTMMDQINVDNAIHKCLKNKQKIKRNNILSSFFDEKLFFKSNDFGNKEDVIRDEDVDYQVGDYVVHEHFGAGKVVDVTNSLVSVAFKHPYGIKKLMKNHKSLTKV